MNPPSYQQQSRDLIDGLKAVCASNGLGNDGNKYKIIVQTFLYKLLCDKFVHEMKRLDPKLAEAGDWITTWQKLPKGNGPWLGEAGKAAHLQEKDVLLLNSRLLKDYATRQWDEAGIDQRNGQAIDAILKIWPVPEGHKVRIDRDQPDGVVTVEIADLLGSGHLTSGQMLYSRPGKYGGRIARVLSDGRIEVDGQAFDSPSQAGIHVRKKRTNGWTFWRLQPDGRRSLKDVRTVYLRVVSPDAGEDDETAVVEID